MIKKINFPLRLAMSCLDVMYQVYGPPQPYFAAAYTPYHQKLAFYSKMQEAPESSSNASTSSGSSSFSSHTPASIKEEDGSPEKERPPEAEYINSRCVLFTYFQGDISSVVDEHFSRALSQPSSYSPGCASSKTPRSSGSWRDGSFPMNQRSFPPSFWNSTYQPAVTASSLSSPLAAAHSDLPFTAADPYSPASLHSHLHQGAAEPWHHAHHHHHHHHHHPHPHPHHPYSLGGPIGAQGTAFPRPASMHEVYGPHFDPRYSSLLMPPASVRQHRLTPASVPTPVSPPCELGKSESSGSAWTTPGGPFPSAAGDMGQSLGLNVDSGLQPQDKSKDLYWF
ncbi:transcription cofactor vestigial-like protein 2 isoform X2 [Monodelphis domestica]|uniref:transcription cofactor vestigial-like protein 2 isoform X2 n=1 Tax=Monodelphis domestica TaxID=13616 RepID=UPI0024E26DE5|nr:transcription cofactor vestigial-like protein 2 isoform X2 [Monodelphis domestica]XP_007484535.2 transcription cofactor vestigial-like protein 2 isoform X2 [Monodelphis domestica]